MHIHSVLSPCGDIDMSPSAIIDQAIVNGLDIIAITDHNATHHCGLMVELGKQKGIVVIPGVEVTTIEEVHCLCYFVTIEQTDIFQEFIDHNIQKITNDSERFGMQLVVNETEDIIKEISNLLIVSLNVSINEIEKKVHEIGGLFVPAHIDRQMNGLFANLGFLPSDLQVDACEISTKSTVDKIFLQHSELQEIPLIRNSDAHFINQIGETFTEFYLEKPSFSEIVMAFKHQQNRTIQII